VSDVAVLSLAVGEVWGMRDVVNWMLWVVEEPRDAAVGSSASLLQRTEKMDATRRRVGAGSLAFLLQRRFSRRNFLFAVEGYPPAYVQKVLQVTSNM